MEKFESGNVTKYVFSDDTYVAETVLYRYGQMHVPSRMVICCSTQSGCPVGCTFCGSGGKFIRNLTAKEIVTQIRSVVLDQKLINQTPYITKFQIMFMSMGEPFLNYKAVKKAIIELHEQYPNAELLISTVGPSKCLEHLSDFIQLSRDIPKIGLQLSLHHPYDVVRDDIIPYKQKLNVQQLRDFGCEWTIGTGRKTFVNYCVTPVNSAYGAQIRLVFPPAIFNMTFSVICEKDESMKNAGFNNLDIIREFEQEFIDAGYNTRIFDPEAQDDIGGGCGQLWYVQQWMKEHNSR